MNQTNLIWFSIVFWGFFYIKLKLNYLEFGFYFIVYCS